MTTKNYYIASAKYNGLTSDNPNSCWVHKLCGVNGSLVPVKSSQYLDETAYKYSTTFYEANISAYIEKHPKKAKSSFVSNLSSRDSMPSVACGVVFGNGTAAESIDDYNMSGDLFTTYEVSSTNEYVVDDNGASRTITYTLTNTGTEDFTVSEIGIIGYLSERFDALKSTGYDYYYATNILLERTLLETPITIPANNGVGQVSYTISMNFIPA